MALGYLIGVAVASAVTKGVVNVASKAIESGKHSGPVVNNTYVYTAPTTSPQPANPPTREVREERRPFKPFIKCEYCDGVITVKPDMTSCPNCCAPILYDQIFEQEPAPAATSRSIPDPEPDDFEEPKNYYTRNYHKNGYCFPCYRCGATIHYGTKDILRSPGANKVVKAAGFKGHTGEVKCICCGAYLPHYENNHEYTW